MIAFTDTSESLLVRVQRVLRNSGVSLASAVGFEEFSKELCQVMWHNFKLASSSQTISNGFMQKKRDMYKAQLEASICLPNIERNYYTAMERGGCSRIAGLPSNVAFKLKRLVDVRKLVVAASSDPALGAHLMLGLQSVRESPLPDLNKLRAGWVDVFCSVQVEQMNKMVVALKEPSASETIDWININSYMDGTLGSFRDWLSMRVLSEFYESQRNWCQGSANLSFAILAGVSRFHKCRDEMNKKSRAFQKHPFRESWRTGQTTRALKKLLLECQTPRRNSAFYIEFDAWKHTKLDERSKTIPATATSSTTANGSSERDATPSDQTTTKNKPKVPWKSTGGHVFVIHANANRSHFAIYSSWRKSYTLSDWMTTQRKCRSVLPRASFVRWFALFSRLVRYDEPPKYKSDNIIWELSFTHSIFEARNCPRNYQSIVRLSRRAYHEAKCMVNEMGTDEMFPVNNIQMQSLNTTKHPFGLRCGYSSSCGFMYESLGGVGVVDGVSA
eukprot:g2756.t1